MDEQESNPIDPIGSQADRLEKALTHLEARKKAAADLVAKNAPQAEPLKALQAKLEALPQDERREVLNTLGLHRVSAAPKPIEPIRGGGFVRQPAPKIQPPRWSLWQSVPRVELWQSVLLSLDIEPDEAFRAEACGAEPKSHLLRGRLPREFFERMRDCFRALSTDGPIRPQEPLYRGMLKDPKCSVLLAEVAAFLVRADCEVPDSLSGRSLSDVPESIEPKEKREDRRLLDCERAGLTMQSQHGRLPDGIGKMAKKEGLTRQTYSADLKAALKRREAKVRAGNTGL